MTQVVSFMVQSRDLFMKADYRSDKYYGPFHWKGHCHQSLDPDIFSDSFYSIEISSSLFTLPLLNKNAAVNG